MWRSLRNRLWRGPWIHLWLSVTDTRCNPGAKVNDPNGLNYRQLDVGPPNRGAVRERTA
jgi:hypothetical protein